MLRIRNPYRTEGFQWLRGNLHTHTTCSDGHATPEETAKAYRSLGYDFLCLSDHDTLTWPYECPEDLIAIPGVEVAGGPHVLAVNVETCVPPEASRQDVVNGVLDAGGFAVLCHPNWEAHFNHFPQEAMEELQGYVGIEIYNGVVDFLEGSALATDRWDMLLSLGRDVWGFAHDDAHHEFAMGRAWIVVQAAERSRQAIVEAMVNGAFYASTGVDIQSVEARDGVIRVAAPGAQRIRFYGQWGRLLHEVDDCEAAYRTGGREGSYVRAECWGMGGRCAWTQPLRIEEEG